MISDETIALLTKGTREVLVAQELKAKLLSAKQLRIKAGFDPTAPDLHLGHSILLNKLRQFQALGHQVYLVVGDFTATIGDPSGKSIMRQPLAPQLVKDNAKSYTDQAFKILDKALTTVVFNSTWLEKLSVSKLIDLASTYTVARMLERDDFHKRFSANQAIALHEFLYPLLQGYDSVAIECDVELGGSDQKFNLLVGRELQKHFGQSAQTVMLLPLLEGLDGVKKMSKSLNNYIGITEAPNDIFGKIMSISDELMWCYYELVSLKTKSDIWQLRQAVKQGKNPRDVKMLLAREIVSRFHHQKAAELAEQCFIARFQKKQLPDDIPTVTIESDSNALLITRVLKQSGLTTSTSEANRMIEQRAVKIAGKTITQCKLTIAANTTHVYQVGKRRVARITIKKQP